MGTNVDLYNRAMELIGQQGANDRSLRDYLAALAGALAQSRNRSALTPGELIGALEAAFTSEPAQLGGVIRTEDSDPTTPDDVLGLLARQVDDLDEMERSGALANDLKYFGIEAPSGHYWFNLDPATFIECGLEGAFGGWQPDSQSSRQLVDGQVAVLTEDGTIESVPAAEVSRPIREVPSVRWEDIARFVIAGQLYE